jgi:predicted ATPase/DNA-binding CsgD family transcriptional regulator
MARSIPRIQNDSLHVPTREDNGTSIITLGTPAWDSWVEHARSFRFETPHASFTARKEQRPGGWYWYAYRRRYGKLHIAYLGKSEELTIERLHTVAAVLELIEDNSEEPSHQPQQRSFDAPLQTHHTPSIPFPLNGADSQTSARPVPQHNLPIQVTSLVGREAAIATATALLRLPEVRLLSMIGTGGIGKTRLAIEVATQLLEDFTDGVYFVALSPLRDPDMVLPTIAHTLGLKESGNETLTERLCTYLRDKQLLLVLDNFEHLMPAAHVVEQLLTTSPELKLLVTSREVLHLRAEQQFSVPPLAVPDRKHVAQVQSLTQYPALELFLQRARAVKHDFQWNTTNAQPLTNICTRLDGLPLAIELAAARIGMLSLQALLARLDHSLQILTHGPTDLPERQQTLRKTIAWSYELLNAEEQRLFRRLSIFVGGCSFEAIEAACNALGDGDGAAHIFESVTSLIDKSLLQSTGQEGEVTRLAMLETIREYGLECLTISGAMEATRHAHAAYYLQLAEEAAPNWFGPEQKAWFDRLELEHDNLRTALNWLLEQGEESESIEMALRLGEALWYFWLIQFHRSEGQDFLERALARSKGIKVNVRAKALLAAGNLAGYRGDFDRGEVLCQESLALFREVRDTIGVGRAVFHLGIVAYTRGDFATARSRFEESLALHNELGDKEYIENSLFFLACICIYQGEHIHGRSLAEASLLLSRVMGDKEGVYSALRLLAREYFYFQGNVAKATDLYKECLTLSRELNEGEGEVLGDLGEVYLYQGNLTMARSLLEESIALLQRQDEQTNKAWSLSLLAKLAAVQDDYTTARAHYEECLRINKANFLANSPWYLEGLAVPSYLEGLAAVVAAQGEFEWAAHLWGSAEAQRSKSGIPLPPVYRADYERAVADARVQFGEKGFVIAWAEGRTMPLDQVLAAQEPVSMAAPIPADRLMAPPVPTASTSELTAREVEVLRLVAQGLSDEQVAEQLVISRHTVNSHLKAIYGKIGVSSRHAATHYALQHHLL